MGEKKMELTKEYLDTVTVIADFWIANEKSQIKSIVNEGIAIKKNKTYLKGFDISIILKAKEYDQMELFAKGWQRKSPTVVITKGSKRVEAFDIKSIKEIRQVGDTAVIECFGKLIEN
jgi:mevalonate pyrophosphate decarboxylase